MTTEEAREILSNKSIHWTIKAQTVKRYREQYPKLSLISIAFNLLLAERNVLDHERLAKAIKEYPSLTKIDRRLEALTLLNKFEFDPMKLRQKIQEAVARLALKPQRLTQKGVKENAKRQRKIEG